MSAQFNNRIISIISISIFIAIIFFPTNAHAFTYTDNFANLNNWNYLPGTRTSDFYTSNNYLYMNDTGLVSSTWGIYGNNNTRITLNGDFDYNFTISNLYMANWYCNAWHGLVLASSPTSMEYGIEIQSTGGGSTYYGYVSIIADGTFRSAPVTGPLYGTWEMKKTGNTFYLYQPGGTLLYQCTVTSPNTIVVPMFGYNPNGQGFHEQISNLQLNGISGNVPVASFNGNVTSGIASLTIQFNDASTNSPTSRLWNFGDGTNNCADQNPVHIFNNPGIYTITLTVTNDYGSNTCTGLVIANDPNSNVFTYADNFYNLNNWNYLPGTRTSDFYTSNNYLYMQDTGLVSSTWGVYGKNSTRINLNGDFDHKFTISNLYMANWYCNAWHGLVLASSPTSMEYGIKIQSTGGGGSSYYGYVSIIADGTLRSAPVTGPLYGTWEMKKTGNTFYLYQPGGMLLYQCTVSSPNTIVVPMFGYNPNGQGFHEQISNLQLNGTAVQIPNASFISNITNGTAPLTVQFNDTSTGNPTNWKWNFGDSTNSTIQNATHTYNNSGLYNVTLTISNFASSSTMTIPYYINITGPLASFTSNVTSGPIPLTIQFYDNNTCPISWHWDFGDNMTSGERNPRHVYTNNGSYNVTLTEYYIIGSNTSIKLNYITVNTSIYNASHISDTTPNYQVVTGQPVAIDITMQNTGNQIWHVENNQVNIQEIDGITQTQCNTPGSTPVISGTTNTFPVIVTAPSQPGNYTLHLQLYHVDNGTNVNFGPIINVPLNVINASVGVAWIVNYTNFYWNNITYHPDPLNSTRPDAEGLYNALGIIGWQQSFDVGDNDVNKDLFNTNVNGDPNPPGYNGPFIDNVDLAYWSGHGSTSSLATTTDGTPITYKSHYTFFDQCTWGFNLKWIGLSSCNGAENAIDPEGRGGVTNAMKGVHVVCGFYTESWDTPDLGKKWAYHMVKGVEPAKNVTLAWFLAGYDVGDHGLIMQVWYGDQNCTNDYIWGQGPVASDPDPNAQKVSSQPYPIP